MMNTSIIFPSLISAWSALMQDQEPQDPSTELPTKESFLLDPQYVYCPAHIDMYVVSPYRTVMDYIEALQEIATWADKPDDFRRELIMQPLVSHRVSRWFCVITDLDRVRRFVNPLSVWQEFDEQALRVVTLHEMPVGGFAPHIKHQLRPIITNIDQVRAVFLKKT